MKSIQSISPGTMGLPVIGETIAFIFNKDFAASRHRRYGSIFKTHVLGRPTVFVAGPEANRFVLSSRMDHFSWGEGWPSNFRTLLGRSLFLQDGEEHRRNRQLMMPAFHGRALAGYIDTMEQITQHYLAKWEQLREFKWFPENKQLTFDIASTLLLGAAPGQASAQLSEHFTHLTQGLFAIAPLRQGWTTFGRALTARKALLEHLDRVIDDRQWNPTNDVLSMLIRARDEEGNGLSKEELKLQALLLLFAGHETTTSMLTSFCLELARHPVVLARARAEQQQVAPDATLTMETIGKMQYLDQIFREIERLHPPVAGGFRGVVKPFDFNGYHVPQGWRLSYNVHQTHRTDAIYPHPERFDPDRFTPGSEQHKHQAFSLVGFGGGPRICLGMAFAQVEMKIVASHLLRSYAWDLVPGQNLDLATIPTLHPRDGLKVSFRYWHGE